MSCDDPETPVIRPPIKVAISPTEVPALCQGESLQLAAVVSGSGNAKVRWRSSSTNIVSVDSTGLLTASSPGSGWVTALAAADTSAQDSVAVTIGQVVLFYAPPTVSIGAITLHNTSTGVDPANVSGPIDIHVDYDMPKCWRGLSVRVRLNDQQVCNQGVTQGHGTLLCIVNTSESSSSGTRRFPNGAASLRADLVASTGVVQANSTLTQLTLNNPP